MASGFAAIGLHQPRNPLNVGEVLRAAGCYGAAMIAASGVRYKRSQPKITSRRPVFEVSVVSADLLGIDTAVAILLEAQDRKGETIGEAMRGGEVDPATGVITLQPGQSADITIKMQDAFEGKFTVKALDPTTLKTFDKVELETDYTV